MTPDQIVSAVRAHLDRIEEVAHRAVADNMDGRWVLGEPDDQYWVPPALADRGIRVLTGGSAALAHAAAHPPSSVLSLTAAIRKLLAEYEECRAYYEANPKDPAGEVLGFWTSIEILAQGLGIDTDKEITE